MSYSRIACAWTDRALGATSRYRGPAHHRDRMIDHEDTIHSYGLHFELARVLRDKRKQPVAFLINGERASVTTTRHQGEIRRAIDKTGLPSVIIPHGALDAAGIDMDSIRILDVSQDWTEQIRNDVDFDPSRPTVSDTGDSDLQRQLGAAWEKAARMSSPSFGMNYEIRRINECWHMFAAARTETWAGGFKRVTYLHGYCYQCEAEGGKGWNYPHAGDCQHERAPHYYTATGIGLEQDSKGWFYTTHRHWLGESLIEADVLQRINVKCNACAGSGDTSDTDYAWRSASMASRRDYATGVDYADAIYPEVRDSFIYNCSTCRGTGAVPGTRRRRAKFLSGFDHAERRPSYFFCELPKTDACTIVDAYVALKPESVKLAEQMGRAIHRQGDIFAVAVSMTSKQVRAMARTIGRRATGDARMLGTNHCATEVAYMPDDTILARGCLYHIPDGRRNDHARVKLGDGTGWFLITKNTVPVRRA